MRRGEHRSWHRGWGTARSQGCHRTAAAPGLGAGLPAAAGKPSMGRGEVSQLSGAFPGSGCAGGAVASPRPLPCPAACSSTATRTLSLLMPWKLLCCLQSPVSSNLKMQAPQKAVLQHEALLVRDPPSLAHAAPKRGCRDDKRQLSFTFQVSCPACPRKQSALCLRRGEMRRDGCFLLALPAWFNEVRHLRFNAGVGSYYNRYHTKHRASAKETCSKCWALHVQSTPAVSLLPLLSSSFPSSFAHFLPTLPQEEESRGGAAVTTAGRELV